jgi:ATP-binding cassette subfamily C protein
VEQDGHTWYGADVLTMRRRSTSLIAHFIRAYPSRTLVMVLLLIGAGLAEAIGVATLLPVLQIALGASGTSRMTMAIASLLHLLRLPATLGVLLCVLVAAVTLKAVLRWVAMRHVVRTVARVACDLRLDLIRALIAARWSYFVSEPVGRLANAVGAEATRAAWSYRRACAALANLIQVFAYTALMVLVSWKIALATLLVGVGASLGLQKFVRTSRRAGGDETTVIATLVARLTDAMQTIKPIKAMGRQSAFLRELEADTRELERAEWRQAVAAESLIAFNEPIVIALIAIGLYATVVWTAQPIATSLVSVFVFYRMVARIQSVQVEYQGMVAAESAFWSLHDQAERATSQREVVHGANGPAPALIQAIELRNVFFAHDNQVILRGVSLDVPAGALVAIRGASGAGKTTLVDLMLGLQQPSSGQVLVDGSPLAELDVGAWRRSAGYVPQDSLLLHDSVVRNITIGADAPTNADVERALREAGALDFVSRLPNGVNTIVGERGTRLSGGEKQRIAIARALVDGPRVLVLDEPLTGLDAAVRASLIETLKQLRGRMTIIAISHDRSIEEIADLSYELRDGVVVPAREAVTA